MICITSSAQSVLGLAGKESEIEVTEKELREQCDADVLPDLFKTMPMADQRGERILLDVNGQGALEWTKAV